MAIEWSTLRTAVTLYHILLRKDGFTVHWLERSHLVNVWTKGYFVIG